MLLYRKFKKLLRNPSLFFEDAKRKKDALNNLSPRQGIVAISKSAPIKPAAKSVSQKPQSSKPAPSKLATAKTVPSKSADPKTMKTSAASKSLPAKKPVGPEINFPRSELSAIQFIVHAGDGAGSEYQFLNWLADIRHSYQRFAIFIRSWDVYTAVKDRLETCNVIFASGATGVEDMVTRMRSLRLVLYVSNTGNNLHLLRYNHLIHAFIGHGDSEKSASCHKFFRAYDEIWVSGQAHIDRFFNAKFETRHVDFVRVGRSNLRNQALDAIARIDHTTKTDSRLAQLERIDNGVVEYRFLYLPTWEGAFDDSSYSSLEYTGKILEELCEVDEYKGAIKFHPMTGRRISMFSDFEKKLNMRFDRSRVQVIPRHGSYFDSYSQVDFLIADISSVITDFLVTLKPIFVCWPGFKNLMMAESKFSIKDYCYTYSTVDELKGLVKRVIVEGEDYLFDMRKDALDYYIDLKATERGAFQKQILRACTDSSNADVHLISA